MAYSYLGLLKIKVAAAHALSMATSTEVSRYYSSGGGLEQDQWPSVINSLLSIDFPSLKARTGFNKTLAQSFVMESNVSTYVVGDKSAPRGAFTGWHWVLMPDGMSFDMTSDGVSSIVGEMVAAGYGDEQRARSTAIGYRSEDVQTSSKLNHDATVYRNRKNTPNFETTLTSSELINAISGLEDGAVLPSTKITLHRDMADAIAIKAIGKKFSESGYTPYETKPKTDIDPTLWWGGGSKPYADAPYTMTFQHPGSFTVDVEMPLYYDSSYNTLVISDRMLDDEGQALTAIIDSEAKTLQIIAAKRAMGEDAVAPAQSVVVPDDYKNPIVRQQAVDWQLAYRVEAEKVNKSPIKDIVTPYLEEQGMDEAAIEAKKAELTTGSSPGTSGWTSAWDTLAKAGSSVGDYMSKWSPADYVGAYAGYKATKVVSKYPWMVFAIVAIGAYAVLK